jgi:hypothetical protein
MPPLSASLLLHKQPPSEVAAADLLEELRLPAHLEAAATTGLKQALATAVLLSNNLLAEKECAVLRAAIQRDWQEKSDTIDGGPDHQLKLSVDRLAELVSESTLARVIGAARSFDADLRDEDVRGMKCFIRRYARERAREGSEGSEGSARAVAYWVCCARAGTRRRRDRGAHSTPMPAL